MTTDKFALGYMKHIYGPLFKENFEKVTSVLEVGTAAGDSLLEWRVRFPNATIYGVDVNAVTTKDPDTSRLVFIGNVNAYSTETVERLRELNPGGYDVLIDDGSHSAEHQQFFVDNYLSLLSDTGILIVEDIIFPGVTASLVDKIDTAQYNVEVHDMRNKQLDAALNARWQTGLDVLVVSKKPKVVTPVKQTTKKVEGL
jgi:predicted O-methyltransferase YrrM